MSHMSIKNILLVSTHTPPIPSLEACLSLKPRRKRLKALRAIHRYNPADLAPAKEFVLGLQIGLVTVEDANRHDRHIVHSHTNAA